MYIRLLTKFSVVSLAALCVMLGSAAIAEEDARVYHWKDKNGTSHFGDYLPPEYAGSGHTVLNEHGVEIEYNRGRRSAEEIAKQESLAVEAAKNQRKFAAAALRDKVLLSTYLSIDEIEALRDRRVELLDGQLRITQKYLDNLRDRLNRLEREARRYSPYSNKPNARPIDEKLARELSNTLNSMLLYEKNLAKSISEQQQIKEKFAADINRFMELQGISRNN